MRLTAYLRKVMVGSQNIVKRGLTAKSVGFFMLILLVAPGLVHSSQQSSRPRLRNLPSPRAEMNLEKVPFRILYETYRKTERSNNWELFLINPDGTHPFNLTNTPDVDEMYPHVSPDGTKICFVVDAGIGRRKVRSIYYMNIDGTDRVKVADNARQPCWAPNSKSIAYLKGEYERYSTREYATSGLFIYNLQTRQHRQHPNKALHHIYAICWSPDGNWFTCAVQGGMEFSDTILAFESNGKKLFDLEKWEVRGCRPDFSLDGKKMTWGETDWNICVGDFDTVSGAPRVTNIRDVVNCRRKFKIYHVDFSPDGKYIAFSYGPFKGGQQVGGKARGWNICVADMTGKWVQITTDGNHNKEPDWVPVAIPNSQLVAK